IAEGWWTRGGKDQRFSHLGPTVMSDAALMSMVRSIVADNPAALDLLASNPELARAHFEEGATRHSAKAYHLEQIGHYIYAGDTALHLAAAAYREKTARKLIGMGAVVRARNRRGAEPLHYAADGLPGSRAWDPAAQAATVTCLRSGRRSQFSRQR